MALSSHLLNQTVNLSHSLKNCFETDKTKIDSFDETLKIVSIVLDVPVALLAPVGNLLTILTILQTPSLRTIANMYVTSLAVTDFVIGVFVTFKIVIFFIDIPHKYMVVACSLLNSVLFSLMAISMLTITVISFDRFLHVRFPLHYELYVSPCVARCIIVGTWLVGVGFGTAPLFEISEEEDPVGGHCHLYFMGRKRLAYQVYGQVGLFLLCCIVSLGSYSYIMVVAVRHRRAIAKISPALYKLDVGNSAAQIRNQTVMFGVPSKRQFFQWVSKDKQASAATGSKVETQKQDATCHAVVQEEPVHENREHLERNQRISGHSTADLAETSQSKIYASLASSATLDFQISSVARLDSATLNSEDSHALSVHSRPYDTSLSNADCPACLGQRISLKDHVAVLVNPLNVQTLLRGHETKFQYHEDCQKKFDSNSDSPPTANHVISQSHTATSASSVPESFNNSALTEDSMLKLNTIYQSHSRVQSGPVTGSMKSNADTLRSTSRPKSAGDDVKRPTTGPIKEGIDIPRPTTGPIKEGTDIPRPSIGPMKVGTDTLRAANGLTKEDVDALRPTTRITQNICWKPELKSSITFTHTKDLVMYTIDQTPAEVTVHHLTTTFATATSQEPTVKNSERESFSQAPEKQLDEALLSKGGRTSSSEAGLQTDHNIPSHHTPTKMVGDISPHLPTNRAKTETYPVKVPQTPGNSKSKGTRFHKELQEPYLIRGKREIPGIKTTISVTLYFTVFGIFFLLWCPMFTLLLVRLITDVKTEWLKIFFPLGLMNSVCNVGIYPWKCPEMCQAMKRILYNWRNKCLPSQKIKSKQDI